MNPTPPDQPATAEPPIPTASVWQVSASTASVLLLFTLAFTALMALVYDGTRPAILKSKNELRLALLAQVLSPDTYDNDLLKDSVQIPPEEALGTRSTGTPATLWRARKAGQPVALVFEAIAPDGYSGRIDLVLAVDRAGVLKAVRVTQHKETPGLGDYIDPKKDRNKSTPWIAQFDNLDSRILPFSAWRVKKDGGQLDAHAGATISARAVTQAVARAVAWIQPQRDHFFAAPAQIEAKETSP